ncbi:putative Sulfotransferase family cytosolic 1B member 1 [Hypsibius exemplaris]|uniref:Sulfotransferase family cytosolic 1B member 1 n=1 Tax=Hypsibius exemplaris TaxID=2072580 RepID=A0A1W0X4X3_HYPEX|nr:putative Sulfotransferase family cytosolic 1B member 1 [Hypsibius exemplaris]
MATTAHGMDKTKLKDEERDVLRPNGKTLPDDPQYDLHLYRGLWLLSGSVKMMPKVAKMRARPDDIVVASFPKSGTTWMQAIVQLIMYRTLGTITRVGLSENDWCFLDLAHNADPMPIDLLDEQMSPRLIKTHLPWDLLPKSIVEKKCKMIYVYRNPKDVMVSLYHFCKNVPEVIHSCPHETFEEFVQAFLKDRVIYAPYFENIASFWQHRGDANVLFVAYEDMSSKPQETISRVANFLGEPLDKETLDMIVRKTSFGEMKKSENVKRIIRRSSIAQSLAPRKPDGTNFHFLRCGKTEEWRKEFSPELAATADKWVTENLAAAQLAGFSF